MPTDFNAITFLIQFGGLGLAFYLIWIGDKKDKRHDQIVSNHLDHSTKVFDKVAQSNIKIAKSLQKLADKINGKTIT